MFHFPESFVFFCYNLIHRSFLSFIIFFNFLFLLTFFHIHMHIFLIGGIANCRNEKNDLLWFVDFLLVLHFQHFKSTRKGIKTVKKNIIQISIIYFDIRNQNQKQIQKPKIKKETRICLYLQILETNFLTSLFLQKP